MPHVHGGHNERPKNGSQVIVPVPLEFSDLNIHNSTTRSHI